MYVKRFTIKSKLPLFCKSGSFFCTFQAYLSVKVWTMAVRVSVAGKTMA